MLLLNFELFFFICSLFVSSIPVKPKTEYRQTFSTQGQTMQLSIFADNSDYIPSFHWSYATDFCCAETTMCFIGEHSVLSGFDCIQCYCQNNLSSEQKLDTIICAFFVFCWHWRHYLFFQAYSTFKVTLLTTMLKANMI